MIKAFSYVRFSSKEQAKGTSLERQTEMAAAYCETHGLTLDSTMRLQDLGVSGFNGNNVKNGALGGFVEAVRLGKIPMGSVLIVENIDRLGRDQVGDALALFISILSGGIKIVTLKPEREYTTESINNIGNLLEPLIEMSRAYEESKRKSDLLGAAWRKRKERARATGKRATSFCPCWMRPIPDGTGFEPIPHRVLTVREIFRLALKGLGSEKIRKKLVECGAEPFGYQQRWAAPYIKFVLNSRATFGEYQPQRYIGKNKAVDDGAPIPNYYPPAINESTWVRTQAVIKARKKGTNRGRDAKGAVNLFRGLLFDARTGSGMHMRYMHGHRVNQEKPIKIYRLVPGTSGTTGSVKGSYLAPKMETAFLKFLRDELKPDDFLGVDEGRDEMMELGARLVSLEDTIKRTSKRIDKEENGDVVEVYLDQLASLQAEKNRVEARLLEARSAAFNFHREAYGELMSYAEMMTTSEDPDGLREKIRSQLRQIVKEIWVLISDEDKNRIANVQVFFHNGMMRQFWTSYPTDRRKVVEPLFTDKATVLDAWVNPGLDLRHWRAIQAAKTIE